ncbi:MAG: ROK family protein, partial [Candidatus Saccharibacteria bacterium]
MYLGIDTGGTKTLACVLDSHGVIVESKKFPTPQTYEEYLVELKKAVKGFKHQEFLAGGVAMPGKIDRKHGRVIKFGNLKWQNDPVQHDLEKAFHCPFVIENDAKLGALSEAMLLRDKYNKVLYVTVSTGIGIGLIAGGKIDTSVGDGGGRALLLEHRGKLTPWEDFAGGKAIVARYKKRAAEITDPDTWEAICRDLAKGLIQLIAIAEPDVIVIGGSVGTYFDRYGKILADELKHYHLPMLSLPDLRQAQRPEEAVVYGCFDLAKQHFPHASAH